MAPVHREFKNKPKDMKISVYLIHTRLFAQGTVIGGAANNKKKIHD